MSTAHKHESFQRPSAGYSLTARLKIKNRPGKFLEIMQKIALEEASLSDVTLLYSDFNVNIRDVTVNCKSEESAARVVALLKNLENASLLEWHDDTFRAHQGGKISVLPKSDISTTDQLARVYTPGVARVCTDIANNPGHAYDYTIKGNTVAIVSDGSAVLGLGNIGPLGAMPVMEGKAMLFKKFADINAFPICLDTQDTQEIIGTIKHISPVFGGINIEDISAPRCFEIEETLQRELDIPVFHDDQHGTAVVVLAGLINALKITGKKLADLKIVVNGFGAGGVACTKILLQAGVQNIIPCDTHGIVYRGRNEGMNPVKQALAEITNLERVQGSVADAMKGADVFVGVSRPGSITRAMVKSMAKDAIVFALSNPSPEIMPDEIKDIARIIATGRSDYANQINNVLCFPGMFKGAMAARAPGITDAMKIAAAYAIADSVAPHELHEQEIIPSVFQEGVALRVAEAVKTAAASPNPR